MTGDKYFETDFLIFDGKWSFCNTTRVVRSHDQFKLTEALDSIIPEPVIQIYPPI